MNDLQEYLDLNLSKVVFDEYVEIDDSYVEDELAKSIIDARNQIGITQLELSKITGIAQANISKIENCNGNPSLKILKRIAKGLNKKLKIRME